MYRLVLVMMITAVAWSSVGCGGPGKPVTRSADSRNQSGGGASDNSNSGNSSRAGAGNQNQDKGDDKAAVDGKSEQSPGGADSKEPEDSDEKKADEAKKESNKKAAETVADSKARLRPGRPAGLGIATGAGGGRKGDDKDDDMKAREDAKKPPVEPKEDAAPPAGIENESPVEKHRFTFFERANYAFSTENETEGFQYLYAHAIAEDNALDEHPIAWYTGINEPRLALRWGVGVDYRAGSFEGDPPIFDIETNRPRQWWFRRNLENWWPECWQSIARWPTSSFFRWQWFDGRVRPFRRRSDRTVALLHRRLW